jgi:hypothetical protein
MASSSSKKTLRLSLSQKIKKSTITKLPLPFAKIGDNSHKTALGRARDPIYRIYRLIKKKALN